MDGERPLDEVKALLECPGDMDDAIAFDHAIRRMTDSELRGLGEAFRAAMHMGAQSTLDAVSAFGIAKARGALKAMGLHDH